MKISEAEIALEFALHFLERDDSSSAEVNIDGAVLKLQKPIFPIANWLSERGWSRDTASGSSDWRGV